MIALLMMLAAVPQQLPAQTGKVQIFGMGSVSCATAWESENKGYSEEWVLGFWSGKNYTGNPMVGSSTDRAGIIGEIMLACAQTPSERLIYVTNAVYEKMRATHR